MTEIKDGINDVSIKGDVRQFYDQVGWQLVDEGLYQNARYEDLRPVAREYIHRCHLRVCRHLAPQGYMLLDAGSGPVQYPEYLEYSKGYQYRVCADISITALIEARKRLENHGLYVVMDIAHVPFKDGAFDGIVSLHTVHHLPETEHIHAFRELHRVLASQRSGAIVNSWPDSSVVNFFEPLIRLSNRIRHLGKRAQKARNDDQKKNKKKAKQDPKGTFTSRHDVTWAKNELGAFMPLEIFPWRSVSVRLTRALIHPYLAGKYWLRLLYWLEERYPGYFGEHGKYPIIVISKNEEAGKN